MEELIFMPSLGMQEELNRLRRKREEQAPSAEAGPPGVPGAPGARLARALCPERQEAALGAEAKKAGAGDLGLSHAVMETQRWLLTRVP